MFAAQLVFALAALLSPAPQERPPAADSSALADVERVRAALERPGLKLTLPDIKPDFTVHIEQRRPLHEIFESPPWLLPHVSWRPPPMPARTAFGSIPIVHVDLLAVANRVGDAWRAHAAHNASLEVRRAIAEYCAA